MGRPQYIPSFFFYKFAQSLADPYTSFEAYRAGNIDQRGNIIGNESSIDPFEYFVIKLKKILDELPPGPTKYKTGNLFGVMDLFSEEASQFGLSKDDFSILLEAELMAKELNEDMATGAAAGDIGTPANAPGANKGNVSGYDPVMGSMMTRSTPMNMFGAVEMFNVPSSEFKLFKVDKGYPKTATGNYIRRYGHRNSNQKLAIRDEETGEIYWLPAVSKKSFAEQYGLDGLDLLNEEKSDNKLITDILKNSPDVEVNKDSLQSAYDVGIRKASDARAREAVNAAARTGKTDPKKLRFGGNSAETSGALRDLSDSTPILQRLSRGSSREQEFVANFFGAFLRTLEREDSNNPAKLDSLKLIDDQHPLWGEVAQSHTISTPRGQVGILGINQKNVRGTSPTIIQSSQIEDLKDAPVEDFEIYQELLNQETPDVERMKATRKRIEDFMATKEGVQRRKEIALQKVKEEDIPYQVAFQKMQGGLYAPVSYALSPVETIAANIMARTGRFRLGQSGKRPKIYFQPQAQQPEAGTLLRAQGTSTPDSPNLEGPLAYFGLDPSEIMKRLRDVQSGEVPPNFRELVKKRQEELKAKR